MSDVNLLPHVCDMAGDEFVQVAVNCVACELHDLRTQLAAVTAERDKILRDHGHALLTPTGQNELERVKDERDKLKAQLQSMTCLIGMQEYNSSKGETAYDKPHWHDGPCPKKILGKGEQDERTRHS